MALNSNNIDYVMTEDEMNNMRSGFKMINEVADKFSKALTNDQRIRLPKMDVSNKVFAQDAITALKNHAELMPAYVKAEPIERDYLLYDQLEEFIGLSHKLVEKLEDTQMLAGSECYTACLSVYHLFESAADAGISGADAAYQSLKKRFATQGNFAEEAPKPAPAPQG